MLRRQTKHRTKSGLSALSAALSQDKHNRRVLARSANLQARKSGECSLSKCTPAMQQDSRSWQTPSENQNKPLHVQTIYVSDLLNLRTYVDLSRKMPVNGSRSLSRVRFGTAHVKSTNCYKMRWTALPKQRQLHVELTTAASPDVPGARQSGAPSNYVSRFQTVGVHIKASPSKPGSTYALMYVRMHGSTYVTCHLIAKASRDTSTLVTFSATSHVVTSSPGRSAAGYEYRMPAAAAHESWQSSQG